MLEEAVDLLTVKMNELPALLALHVIAALMAAVFRTDILIASRRFLIDNVLVDKTVGSQAVQTPVNGGLADIDPLRSEMVRYLLAGKVGSCVILKKIKDLT